MEIKKYKPEFVLDYLFKNRKKYNKYFQNKMKDIDNKKYDKIHIFYDDLTKEHVNYIVSQHLDISFNPWDISTKKN